MIVPITLLCFVLLSILTFRYYLEEKFDPEYSEEINGKRTYVDGYFRVTKYFKRDRVVAVKVESPQNDFALYAKKPVDPDEDSMEFYKLSRLMCTRLPLQWRVHQWDSEPLVRFMQRRMNAWANRKKNDEPGDPFVNMVSDREAFKRIGDQVIFK